MSTETESVLTPEEWERRGIQPGNNPFERDLYIVVTDAGTLMVDTSGREYDPWDCTTDARKLMALANLSLTLEQKPGALTLQHFDICHAAAWHFRQLARSQPDTETGNAIRKANHHAALVAVDLARIIRAMLPPK